MDRQRHSFVIRIWFEYEPNTAGYAPALRGSVQLIGSEQVYYFDTFLHLTHSLEKLTGWRDGEPQSDWSSISQTDADKETLA